MKKLVAAGLLLLSLGSPAQEAPPQECKLLVAKAWIVMGTTSITGCFKFAEAASLPNQRQFARLGTTDLKIEGGEHFQSFDDGNSWQRVTENQATATIRTLNVLGQSRGSSGGGTSMKGGTPARRARSNSDATPTPTGETQVQTTRPPAGGWTYDANGTLIQPVPPGNDQTPTVNETPVTPERSDSHRYPDVGGTPARVRDRDH